MRANVSFLLLLLAAGGVACIGAFDSSYQPLDSTCQ